MRHALAISLLLQAAISPADARPRASAPTRRYNTSSGPVSGVVNVHMIAHTHDDVGWLKTAEQYYQGSSVIGIDPDGDNLPSVYYASGGVQFILTSVVQALAASPDRKFTVVEQYFFQRWFMNSDAQTQALVHTLVQSGQLVFANGGLVMHDEAGPTYIDMVDQTTAGVRWIAATFGPNAVPRVQSQLDPFGHSATHAAVLASPTAGYIATFHARMDYEEVAKRRATQTMDFAWAPSASLGLDSMTMGGLGFFGYSSPDGFCFDLSVMCQAAGLGGGVNNPVNDDAFPDAEDNNVQEFVDLVLQTAQRQEGAYPRDPDGTVHLPWTMGDDFQYQGAHQNFASLDKLIHYVNMNTSLHGVNVFYSTQAQYAQSRITMQTPLTLKTSDAMPYCDGPHSCWSGYFTSRAALKGFVRETSTIFQAAKQLQAWVAPPQDLGFGNPLWLLETGMGVAQHHDAVAGTSKQVVAFDYAKRLQLGRDAAAPAVSSWMNTAMGSTGLTWVNCDLANATICELTEGAGAAGSTIALAIYNAGSQLRAGTRAAVRVPVPINGPASWTVLGPDGVTPVPAQLVPASSADAALRVQYYGAAPASIAWLCFFAPSVPAAGYSTVFLQPAMQAGAAPTTVHSEVIQVPLRAYRSQSKSVRRPRAARAHSIALDAADVMLSNGVVSLTFDASSGLLSGYSSTDPTSFTNVPLSQTLLYFNSSTGDAVDAQASGAYIFRPQGQDAIAIASTGVNLTIVTGPIVNEARQEFAVWATQVIRLWANVSNSFDLEWTVGPIPVVPLEGPGKEVISRINVAGWLTNATWWTDSNGREMQQRVRNARPDYTLNVTEPVAQNYYPVNTGIRMRDANTGAVLTVLTDRTQAGGSVADGSLDLMVHRRLTADDMRGVMEALDEPGVNDAGLIVRGNHRIILTRPGPPTAQAHKAALQDSLLPLLWRGAPLQGISPSSWIASGVRSVGSPLAAPLPANLFMLTAHAWNPTTLLVRLAHLFEAGEDPVFSQNVTVALTGLFDPAVLTVTSVTEMTTTAGQPLASVAPVTYQLSLGNFAAAATPSTALTANPMSRRPRNHAYGGDKLPLDEHWLASLANGGVQSVTLPRVPAPPAGANFTVTVGPMQIRTFLCTVARPPAA